MKRRRFIQNTTLALAAGTLLPHHLMSKPFNSPQALGLALFTLPKSLATDFEGTLKMISEIGYKELEFFGPYEFSDEATKAGWKMAEQALGFSGSGYFGKSPKEIRALLDRYGLSSPAIHVDIATLQNSMADVAEAAQVIGHQYVGIAAIPDDMRRNLDDYKKTIDIFNAVGESAKSYGLTFFYHNHGYGHQPMEGVVPFEMILENTDPELVKMEMDVFWFTAAGVDPIRYLKENSNRFPLFHMKDMSEMKTFPGDGGNMMEWMSLFPYLTDAGSGVLDLQGIICEAKKQGGKHFFLEKDNTPEPESALKISYGHLAELAANC